MTRADITAVLYAERDMEEADFQDIAQGRAAVFTRRSPVKTTPNEDAVLLLPVDETRAVLAVADGVGGQPRGETASSIALTTLATSVIEGTASGLELRDSILNGIELANTRVLELGTGAGTTVAVAEIDGDTMRSYHVGDSAILVTGGGGKLKHITIAHSPTGYAVAAGFLLEEEALAHAERHLVSNILGDAEMKIEIGPSIKLAQRDTLVIASDGLSDNLRVDEIIETSRRGTLRNATQHIVATCGERMSSAEGDDPHKPDDLALVLFRRRRKRAGR